MVEMEPSTEVSDAAGRLRSSLMPESIKLSAPSSSVKGDGPSTLAYEGSEPHTCDAWRTATAFTVCSTATRLSASDRLSGA